MEVVVQAADRRRRELWLQRRRLHCRPEAPSRRSRKGCSHGEIETGGLSSIGEQRSRGKWAKASGDTAGGAAAAV